MFTNIVLFCLLYQTIAFNTISNCYLCGLSNCDACTYFNVWASVNDKVYSSTDYNERLKIWEANRDFIMKHNSDNKSTYKMSLNRFADLTFAEFSKKYLMPKQKINLIKNEKANLNTSVIINWQVNGFVPEVTNQQSCGSCWAFSAAEAMSAYYALSNNVSAPTLSPQELVDCVPSSYNCNGCDGGYPNRAMEYALKYLNGGLNTYTDYPYVGSDQACNTSMANKTVQIKAKVYNITSGSQQELISYLYNNGPISVCIDAEQSFQFYKMGIYNPNDCSSDTIDHAILLYGLYYDPITKRYAYMVRNSWGLGTDGNDNGWGDHGDIYMDAEAMNGNICAIASLASTLVKDT